MTDDIYLNKILIWVLSAFLAVALVLLGGAFFLLREGSPYRYRFTKEIHNNVYVAGIHLGGMNKKEAKEALEKISFAKTMEVRLYTKGDDFDTYTTSFDPMAQTTTDIYGNVLENAQQTAAIPVASPAETDEDAPLDENGKPYLRDTILSLPGDDVQLSLNIDSAVDAAYEYGRGTKISKKDQRIDVDISEHLFLNEAYILEVLESALEDMEQTGTETTVEKTVTTITDKDGNPQQVEAIEITIGTLSRKIDINDLYQEIRSAYMQGNYDLQYVYEESYPEPCDLDKLFKDYKCKDPVNAVCDPDTYEITDGELGFGFRMADAIIAFEKALPGDSVILTLTELEPDFTREKLEAELFCDVLGSYDSPHVYNPTRTHNLELACEAINGTIINPGEVFSFNEVVGARTQKNGFYLAWEYVYTTDNKHIVGSAHGLCHFNKCTSAGAFLS